MMTIKNYRTVAVFKNVNIFLISPVFYLGQKTDVFIVYLSGIVGVHEYRRSRSVFTNRIV